MGIRLDWEIEAEQNTYRAGEAADAARVRRSARLRLFLIVALLLVIFGAVAAALQIRLRDLERREEQLLRDVVDAEITNLRLGNYEAFAALQRSGDMAWIDSRQQEFDDYQGLMIRSNVQLTGQITDIVIDDTRARVEIEEIIDSVPYNRVWFYWRYPDDGDGDGQTDGWRHVPPDYTFWGDSQTYKGQFVTVAYRSVDEQLAASLGGRLDEWIQIGCVSLNCGTLPTIRVDIQVDDDAQLGWGTIDDWLLLFPSPYVNRARADLPFAPELQIETASLLAERLVLQVNGGIANYPADAYYLRQAVVSWLVGRFVQIDTGAYLIHSLANNYNETAVGELVQTLQPDSQINILSEIRGVSSLDQLSLDWRDFFTWRLTVESDLINQGQRDAFLALYDTRDTNIQALADERYNQNTAPEPQVVTLVQPTAPAADGLPQQLATVQIGVEGSIREETILFRLVDKNWRRAN
ncbi:MAG: hypothetical protein H7Y09_06425 [Chitinophagaceae bacterium]|nr:hypothetical protein [Anaerolineae bacterium]